ncbi:helix-turn-helix domain-containing protein [Flavobacterium plurextorum]|uniref:Helix-turn-helix domain-containing protein n=1 Tax=Flavobacterium quisquiliarum TaxID=1834436 RepID=A0ABV8W2J0_9FLAO|nr:MULTISPECIES: helix-turn-helix domain-containing protein [Flavobacterium]MBW1656015.1 helix-turn-helix domain-containing protein [Flavobacterium quisquiliarum]UUW07222.1 helix-turn-helix domain-containing protein [Flavobacterium plurextorum]
MKYIIAIGIFQALLAAVLLLRSRYRKNADDLLISLVVCIGLHLSIKFFIFTFVQDQQVLNMLNTFIGFCYIPLLYLYTLKTIRPEFVSASKWYVFIPFVIGAIGYFSTVCVLSVTSPNAYLVLYWYNTISLYTLLPLDIIFSLGIIYLAIHKLPRNSQEKKLIVQLASLFLSIGILSVLLLIFSPSVFSLNYVSRSVVYTLLVVITIRIITYKHGVIAEPVAANLNDEILVSTSSYNEAAETTAEIISDVNRSLPHNVVGNTLMIEKETLKPQRRKEILSQSEMFKILLKLEKAMESEKYYRNSELTLDGLAKLTSINKYHISETLNHFVNKPFYTFINEYRIGYVKEQLKSLSEKSSSINILDLAYESGFNSKSSFNKYFKEITSHTPREYINLIAAELVV